MTTKLKVLDLFSGIGGFSLGLERTGGFETVAFCEIDPFCRRVLAKHWPDVPCFEDVTTLRGEDVGPVDVISGGFPCQDLSVAGKGEEAYAKECAAFASEGREPWPYDKWKSILVWQRYASPVWMDINQTRTLQYRGGRDEKDEVHISPLQLDVIERCIDLWSLPGETVLTPFLGIGSEVYAAVEMGRKGIGFELKPSYFAQAVRNLAELDKARTDDMFAGAAA